MYIHTYLHTYIYMDMCATHVCGCLRMRVCNSTAPASAVRDVNVCEVCKLSSGHVRVTPILFAGVLSDLVCLRLVLV